MAMKTTFRHSAVLILLCMLCQQVFALGHFHGFAMPEKVEHVQTHKQEMSIMSEPMSMMAGHDCCDALDCHCTMASCTGITVSPFYFQTFIIEALQKQEAPSSITSGFYNSLLRPPRVA